MYKYQEETIKQLKNAIDNIEEKTEEYYRVKIGTVIDNDTFEAHHLTIFAEINGQSYFTEVDANYNDIHRSCHLESYNRIHFDKDIFLKLNQLIDQIFKENKERKEFHERLNLELKGLNKILNLKKEE